MGPLISVMALVGFLVVWVWFLRTRAGRPMWSPFFIAFSTTTVAALFVISGIAGYTLGQHDRFTARTDSSGGVIWNQLLIGLFIALIAAFFWRKALRSIKSV